MRVVILTLVFVFAAISAGAQPPRATVRPLTESETVPAGSETRIAVSVSLPPKLHVQADKPRDPSLIPTVLTVEPPSGVRVSHLIYPHPEDFTLEGQSEPLLVFDNEFVVGASITLDASVPAGELKIPGRFRYQACDDKMCFQPRTERFEWTLLVVGAGGGATGRNDALAKELASGRRTEAPAPAAFPLPGAPSGVAVPLDDQTAVARLASFTVQGSTGGYLGTSDFLQFIRDAEAGVASRGLFEGRGPLAILLIILVGGLALNLTPCVLPMIPINLAIIGAGTQAGSRRRGFLLGSTYGAAMAVVYGVLGLIVVLTAGTFGTINSSPWFNLSIAVLFVALGLAMFDVIDIDFSKYSSGLQNPTRRGTFGLAFFMGAVAALLAGACVAPVVIQVVLFSSSLYAGGTPLALALPFVLGVGMAIPWPIAGAGLAALPRPGAWMVRVKQTFGVVILATAAYYGYLSYTLFDNLRVDAKAVSGSVQEMLSKGWTNSLAAGLERAERENKPVLIDFWATWCKNCLTMDKTTLENPEVTAALKDYVKIKFQAEDPDAEPARSVMARFNAVGLPTYVILKPNAEAQGASRSTP
jgi:cytochrome c biogenesis protein CcdA/DsbC/DsbD-like thiol-disulfide interchange protein